MPHGRERGNFRTAAANAAGLDDAVDLRQTHAQAEQNAQG